VFRRALYACLAALACSQPAWAQTHTYVSGDLFADVRRMSRVTSPLDSGTIDTSPPDSVSVGGGGRIGAFFSPEWSLELGVDAGKETSATRTVSIPLPAGFPVAVPTPRFDSRTSGRFVATSVLIGYHPRARARARAGFRGGLSVMRTDATFTSVSSSIITPFPVVTITSPLAPPVILQPITVTTNEIARVAYGMFATLAGEVAIDISSHFAVVPEVRAHVNTSTLLVRPGVAARWRW
jgi:hypothetical protein